MKSLCYLFTLLPFISICQPADSLAFARELDSLFRLNQHLLDKRNFPEALKTIESAASKAQNAFGTSHPLYGDCLYHQGNTAFYSAQYKDAEAYALKALGIFEKAPGRESRSYALALDLLGCTHFQTGNYEKSVSAHSEAKRIQETVLGKENPDYARTLSNLANAYSELDNYRAAEACYLEARPLFERFYGKNTLQYAKNSDLLASIYADMSYYEKAEILYLEAKAILEGTHPMDSIQYSFMLNNLAILYREMGKYDKVEPYYLAAKDIREKLLGKTHPLYAQVVNNLALFYSIIGNYQKAERFYLEAKEIRLKLYGNNSPRYAHTLNGLGGVYFQMGDNEKAEQYLLEAKAIRKATLGTESPVYASSLQNLGALYQKTGDCSKAIAYFSEALAIHEKMAVKDESAYTSSLNNMALALYKCEKSPQAEHLLLKAREINERSLGKENPDYIYNVRNLARLYRSTGAYEKAEPLFLEGLLSTRMMITQGAQYLSENELSLFTQNETEFTNLFLTFAREKGSPALVAAACDNTLYSKGALIERARSLEKSVLTAPDSLRDIHVSWKGYRRRLAAQYALPVGERSVETIAELESGADSLEKILIRSLVGFEGARQPAGAHDVRRALRPGEAAIEFVHYRHCDSTNTATDSTFYIALVLRPDRENPGWITLFEEKKLDSLLRRPGERKADYVNHLYATPERGLVRTGTTLYQLIWKPLEQELDGVKTVYFSPTGLLHRLNLGAIPTSADSVLADRYQLTQLGSTRQIVVKNRATPAGASPGMAVLFGGIRYEPDSAALRQAIVPLKPDDIAARSHLEKPETPGGDSLTRGERWDYMLFTKKEVDAVAASLQANNISPRVMSNFDATEEAFKTVPTGTFAPRILHVATHGFFFPETKSQAGSTPWEGNATPPPVFKTSDNPMMRSGLLMAGSNHAWQTGKPLLPDLEDGILTAYEISQMDLQGTELAVLSACETGLGEIRGDEGVYGLQRAFKIAGTRYLIMSLWKIPDRPTSRLMTTFYRKWLEEKMEIPEAFRAAQREMREIGFEPYEWAGFVLLE